MSKSRQFRFLPCCQYHALYPVKQRAGSRLEQPPFQRNIGQRSALLRKATSMAPKPASNVYRDYTLPSGGGGLFFKFEDGKSVRVRIAGPPYVFSSTYNRNGEISTSTKYAWVIYNKDEDRAQILQLPVTAFRRVKELGEDEDWGDPIGYDLKISRRGTGLETQYTVNPSDNKASLTHDQQAKVDAVTLTDKIPNAILLSDVVSGADIPPSGGDTAAAFDGAEHLSEDDIPPEYRG